MPDRNDVADLVLVLHFVFVLFNVGMLAAVMAGHRRRWRVAMHAPLRRFHLAAVWFVAVETLLGFACPLTVMEDWLRSGPSAEGGFLQRWISVLLYWDLPPWVFALAYLAFALAVAVAYRKLPPALPR